MLMFAVIMADRGPLVGSWVEPHLFHEHSRCLVPIVIIQGLPWRQRQAGMPDRLVHIGAELTGDFELSSDAAAVPGNHVAGDDDAGRLVPAGTHQVVCRSTKATAFHDLCDHRSSPMSAARSARVLIDIRVSKSKNSASRP